MAQPYLALRSTGNGQTSHKKAAGSKNPLPLGMGSVKELLVLPEYQNQGVGSHLLQLAKASTPTMLYFGSQPGTEGFYEKNGCRKGMQSYTIEKKRVQPDIGFSVRNSETH